MSEKEYRKIKVCPSMIIEKGDIKFTVDKSIYEFYEVSPEIYNTHKYKIHGDQLKYSLAYESYSEIMKIFNTKDLWNEECIMIAHNEKLNNAQKYKLITDILKIKR